jgi:uncharacterized iron-regulated membrane protein
MTIKKIIGKIHLWLGLLSGPVVLFLGITGCILAFEREIEEATQPYRYVATRQQAYLPPTAIKAIAEQQLPGKPAHSVTYGRQGRAAVVTFYHSAPDYYYLVYIDPYSGAVLKVKDMSRDFFRIVVNGHFYLWLPPKIGQPIVASATLIFVVMMISGMVLWWPKNKAARKQRFSIKWDARWRRRNYDLHNVLGFYVSWVAIFIAITGLVWGFQWFSALIYGAASGGKKAVAYYEPISRPAPGKPANAPDILWQHVAQQHRAAQTIEVHFPETDSAAIAIAINPDQSTYWKIDNFYYDQYTLREIPVKHMYGKLANTTTADKIARMNYDIHVGAVLGLPGKIMAFCASLLVASLPVTGFVIWRGRKKGKKKT